MNPKELLQLAIKAAETSHSPYSHFAVGAAVIGASGKAYDGCNIENASYGLTICAERVAIFKAISAGETRITSLACACVNGDPGQPSTLMCCGSCLQVMAEFMKNDSEVIIGFGAEPRIYRFDDLLPHPFRL